MKHPRSTARRAADIDRKLGLLLAEVDGYGCKDMTHNSEMRVKWHVVERDLQRARATLQRNLEI